MVQKDLKKINLILSTSLTTTFEALINLIKEPAFRQIFNPLVILLSILISFFITHKIKGFSHGLIIKNNEEEIKELSNNNLSPDILVRINALKTENYNLKRAKSKIDLF
jgi:hypothetical protein